MLTVIFVSCEKKISVTGVAMNKPNLTLGVGETETLLATVLPEKASNKTVTWTSSNVLVATVMPNGLVTALNKGITTIVVTTIDGGYTATCTVKVDEIPVADVRLNKNTLILDIGETETLIATVLPENATIKEVFYTSNKPSVAIVGNNNGIISPIDLGKAIITVTTIDGNKTAKCELEVIKRVNVTGVKLDKTKIDLGVGTREQLTATVTPSNATNKNISWNSSNPLIASVDKYGLVSAKTEGTVDISVITEDGSFNAKCEVKCMKFTSPVLTTLEPTDIVYDTWYQGSVDATFTGEITNAGTPEYFERGFVCSSYYSPTSWEPGCGYDPPVWVKVPGSGTGQFSKRLVGYCPFFVCAYVKTSLGITYGKIVIIEKQ